MIAKMRASAVFVAVSLTFATLNSLQAEDYVQISPTSISVVDAEAGEELIREVVVKNIDSSTHTLTAIASSCSCIKIEHGVELLRPGVECRVKLRITAPSHSQVKKTRVRFAIDGDAKNSAQFIDLDVVVGSKSGTTKMLARPARLFGSWRGGRFYVTRSLALTLPSSSKGEIKVKSPEWLKVSVTRLDSQNLLLTMNGVVDSSETQSDHGEVIVRLESGLEELKIPILEASNLSAKGGVAIIAEVNSDVPLRLSLKGEDGNDLENIYATISSLEGVTTLNILRKNKSGEIFESLGKKEIQWSDGLAIGDVEISQTINERRVVPFFLMMKRSQ